ncbi:unnamed protein product [Ambrosiozyma monospora]|uniref:Unnamed protein product n=1 Tax=Ambrosiozyma monospora TaxID=43982 RepID=A0A9W6YZB8_AMBMO|nr:unnamed protein product [Ambrosiozyma monospora]
MSRTVSMTEKRHRVSHADLCFLKLKSSHDGSTITLPFKLYTDKLPKTTTNFKELLVGKQQQQLQVSTEDASLSENENSSHANSSTYPISSTTCTNINASPTAKNGTEIKPMSYKKSSVTRVISPEYIIQLGMITKRSKKSIDHCLTSFKDNSLVDSHEYNANINTQKFNQKGLLCLVDNPVSPIGSVEKDKTDAANAGNGLTPGASAISSSRSDSNANDDGEIFSKFEFFITLTDKPYVELSSYLIIGELIGSLPSSRYKSEADSSHSSRSSSSTSSTSSMVRKLNRFFSEVEVDFEDRPADGFDCFIDRCGVLLLPTSSVPESDIDGKTTKMETTTASSNEAVSGEKKQVNAFDALYGGRRVTKRLKLKK